jgi:hypothetical protein
MGTDTVERTAKALVWTNSSTQATEIDSLRTAIAEDEIIYAADLNRIGVLINNMNGHYHTYDDAYSLKTFGTKPTASSPLEDKNTNSIDSVTTAPVNTAQNTTISFTRHNELRASINNLRSHLHGIDDRTAI